MRLYTRAMICQHRHKQMKQASRATQTTTLTTTCQTMISDKPGTPKHVVSCFFLMSQQPLKQVHILQASTTLTTTSQIMTSNITGSQNHRVSCVFLASQHPMKQVRVNGKLRKRVIYIYIYTCAHLWFNYGHRCFINYLVAVRCHKERSHLMRLYTRATHLQHPHE